MIWTILPGEPQWRLSTTEPCMKAFNRRADDSSVLRRERESTEEQRQREGNEERNRIETKERGHSFPDTEAGRTVTELRAFSLLSRLAGPSCFSARRLWARQRQSEGGRISKEEEEWRKWEAFIQLNSNGWISNMHGIYWRVFCLYKWFHVKLLFSTVSFADLTVITKMILDLFYYCYCLYVDSCMNIYEKDPILLFILWPEYKLYISVQLHKHYSAFSETYLTYEHVNALFCKAVSHM